MYLVRAVIAALENSRDDHQTTGRVYQLLTEVLASSGGHW